MAVYRRPNSPFWYFDVSVGGRRRRVSTKRTLKREAEQVEASFRTTELNRVQHGQGPQELTLDEALFTHYLPTKRSRANFRDYEQRCEKITSKVPGVSGLDPNTPFHEITSSMLVALRAARESEGAAAQTIDHEFKVLSGAYHLLKEDYRVRPGLKFPMARPKGRPRPLLPDEEAALLAELDPGRLITPRGRSGYYLNVSARPARMRQDNYDLVVMLLDTGARYGEIARLTWDVVDTIHWRTLTIYRTKVDNQGTLALTARMREVLQRRYKQRGNSHYVFAGWSRSNDDAPRRSTAAIRAAMAKVGINDADKVARFGRRDVRSLRDTFATKLRRLNVPLDRLQPLLGHSSPTMTAKYADLGVLEASEEAAALLDANTTR